MSNTKLSEKEIEGRMALLPLWTKHEKSLIRELKFTDFVAAMVFVNHVADLAEQADHHPDILIRYNKVRLTLSTHSAGGLTVKDFKLAKQIDE